MSAEFSKSIYTLITADPGISALTGPRVYPLLIPPEVWDSATTKPCLVYSTTGVERQVTTCGTDSLVSQSVDIDAYARTFAAVQLLADAVRAKLIDFSGTVGGTYFNRIFLDSEFDLHDIEPGLYRVMMVFTIWHRGI